MDEIEIVRPDDWHVHLRDGSMLRQVVRATADVMGRATVMPNLSPPVTTIADARAYRRRIIDANLFPLSISGPKPAPPFEPLMTLYLTDDTDIDELRAAADCDWIIGAKLYPAGVTTNAENGIADPLSEQSRRKYKVMEKAGLPLLVHGELVRDYPDGAEIDFFDREQYFITQILERFIHEYPKLQVVLEHVSTKFGVQWVRGCHKHGRPIAATITPHHMILNRNALFRRGLDPEYFCYPILQSEDDRRAVVEAATSGLPCFFAGSDSAPHEYSAKFCRGGSGGIFSAANAIGMYAEVFERAGALNMLEVFTSKNGADFFGRPHNADTITLVRKRRNRYPTSLDTLSLAEKIGCEWCVETEAE